MQDLELSAVSLAAHLMHNSTLHVALTGVMSKQCGYSHTHVPDAALHLCMGSACLQAGPPREGQLVPLVVARCHEQSNQALIFL